MADRNEDTVAAVLGARAALDVPQPHAGDDLVAQDVLYHRVPDKADLRVLSGAVLHDLGRPEGVAAVHHRHARGELREEERLLHGSIPAADHDQLLAAKEEPVAG